MTIDGSVAQPGGGNDDPAYVVFGYGSLIFRVRKTALTTSRLTFEPRYALALTARHQRKYVAFRCSLFLSTTRQPRDSSKATSVDSHRNRTTTVALPQYGAPTPLLPGHSLAFASLIRAPDAWLRSCIRKTGQLFPVRCVARTRICLFC